MDSTMYLAALHGDTALYANLPTNIENVMTSSLTPLNTVTSTTKSSIMASTVTPVIEETDNKISMNNFYPALVQCFGIIICGYLAGRFKIISNAETKGLSTFVSTFALPSLIFLSLVELNWGTVNWKFLLAMLVSKAIVFFIVLLTSLCVARPLNYARAGLLGIFCTQSNDFAIGYPIVLALYKDIHPEYASYLYLMAPISLAILNPIGLILLEISKISKNRDEVIQNSTHPPCSEICSSNEEMFKRTRCVNERVLLFFTTFKSLFFNPLLMMTMLGTAGAFLFPHGLPEILTTVLRVFGQSFAATSSFLLGLKMVGQGSSLRGSGFLLPSILILVKILVLPLVCRQTVNIMQAGVNLNDTTELSTFGFLYGTFPAAPGAFVIATQYDIDVELLAKSMVLCTFISAPLMFISAKMISLTNLNPVDYLHELDAFAFDISIVGLIGCIWVLMLLIVNKRWSRMPHRITFCLVTSQLMSCVGVMLWSKLEHVDFWLTSIQFFLFNIGTYGSRLWTANLAICLLLLQCRSLCFVLKIWPYMIVLAWGMPSLISSLLLMFDDKVMSDEKHGANFQYGTSQVAVSVFILVMCFIVTVGCLVMHQRYKKRYEKYLIYSRELSNPESETTEITVSTVNLLNNSLNSNVLQKHRLASCSSTSEDEEILHTENAKIRLPTNKLSDNISRVNQMGNCCSSDTSNSSNSNAATSTTTAVVDIEDILNEHNTDNNATSYPSTINSIEQYDERNISVGANICNSTFHCNASTSRNCQSIIERYAENAHLGLEPLEHTHDGDEHQTLKHTVLIVILLCSMFVSLAVSIWTLIMEGMSGIYLELSFLDTFLNFGQSLIVMAIFINDTGELLTPIIKMWRNIWYGSNTVTIPHWSQLSAETKHICEQFRNHHLELCKRDIAKDRRWRIKTYKKVFYGCNFVDWLIEMGLSKDRLEAVHYAKHLVNGRILRHINNVYHFEDKQLLYKFCSRI